MIFEDSKPIYLQIGDLICENILLKKWKSGERIPSVRDFAVAVGVNPNTVNRIYTILQEKKVIYNQRGIGYFVHDNASEIVQTIQQNDFISNELPVVIRKMKLYGISMEDFTKIYNEICVK